MQGIKLSVIMVVVTINISLCTAQVFNHDSLKFVSETLVWGGHNDVMVVEDIAYVANDLGLLLIDVSNTSAPRLVGKYISENSQNWGIYVLNEYAYLTNRYNGLDIIAVTSPNNPLFMGNWGQGSMPYSYAVCVQNSFAYLASLLYGLVILDVSDPTHPMQITTYPLSCRDVFVRHDFAYIIGEDKLMILDISKPAIPESIAVCETPGDAYRLCLSSNYAYIADGDSGLTIVDIFDPTNPEILGRCTTNDFALDVYVVGRYAYVADKDSGLTIVDVIDPENPVVVGDCATPGSNIIFQGVCADSCHAYLTNEDAGLQLLDVTSPTDPLLVGRFDATGFNGVTEIVVNNSYAHLIDRSEGLKILDITSVYAPQLIGIFEDDRARGISLNYPYAYVASENIDLMVINVSDPHNPSLIGSYDTPFGAQDIHTVDTLAYFIAGGKLFIINVSNPHSPSFISSVEFNCGLRDLYVENSYAYVVCNDTAGIFSGLYIVDASAPSSPQLVAQYAVDYFAFSVYVRDSMVYIGEGALYEPHAPGRLTIVNVANPSNPTYVGQYNIPDGIVLGIYVDSLVYVAAGSAGIKIVDVCNPNSPELVCEYNTPGVVCDLFISPPAVFVGDHYSFIVLHYLPTGLEDSFSESLVMPRYFLQSNFPNPFTSNTYISYQLCADSYVSLNIYDVTGNLIRTLANEIQKPGQYTFVWNGNNNAGEPVSAGVYFYQIRVGNENETKKAILAQ
jgi:hypothetical protein